MLGDCYACHQHFHSAFLSALAHTILICWFSKYRILILEIAYSLQSLAIEQSILYSLAEIETICQYFPSLFDLLTATIINFTPFQNVHAHLKNLRLNTGVISTEHSTPGNTQEHIIELRGRLHSVSLTQDILGVIWPQP